jgi:LysR family hydrogen peroxide-inducible transcriptional activator
MVDAAKASAADEPDAGRLVVAAIPTIAPYFLPPVVASFCDAYPKAQVEIIEEPTASILTLLVSGGADCGVLGLPIRADNLMIEPLFEEELLAVLPADHPLAAKKSLTLEDLAVEPFVLLNDAHCLSELTMSFCKRKSLAPIATARLHQLATVLELVRLGRGVSLVPAMAAAQDSCKGRLYRSLSGDPPKRTVAVATSALHFRTKLLERFLGWVKERTASVNP